MGGLMHLFDFNQALAGRKLLTDKKSAAGLEAPTNSLDVGGSIPEVPKSNGEKNEEVLKVTASRGLKGMPIKALIARELSKESDVKNHAPSVVARLMGLDALPTDSKVLQKPSAGGKLGKIDEKFTQRSVVERQRHEEITPNNVRLYAKKAKASVVSGQKSCGPLHSDSQDGKSGSDSLPLRNHPQEQQLQEFKKEFEAWQSEKSWGHSKKTSRLDEIHAHMPSQQELQPEKRFNPKLPTLREKFSSAKLNAPQDRLHESREFQDALDFLQANKEFFMRFLHEPNSLFARHLQDNESDSISPPQAMEGTKQRRPHRAAYASEGSRFQSWDKDSPISRQYLRSDGGRDEPRPPSWAKESPILRSSKGDIVVERSILSMPLSPLISGEESPGLQVRHRNAFAPMAPENKFYNANCNVPTRIVVLKPSPGKVRNVKSVSPVYCRSPKDQNGNDGFRQDTVDVLGRLREKLRKDSSGEYKRERRSAGINIDEQQYRDVSKDPREIAQEIARQVRENITRDLMVDPRCLGNVPSNARDTSSGRRTIKSNNSWDTDVEACGRASRPSWDNYPRSTSVSLHRDKSSDLEALHEGKEDLVRALEQTRIKTTRVSDGSMSQGHDFGSKNGVFHQDSNGKCVLGQKVLRTSRAFDRYHLNGLYVNEACHPPTFYKPTGQVEGSMRSDPVVDMESLAHNECAEENKPRILKTLFRSQSANLATPGDANMADLQMYGGLEDHASEVGSARVTYNMVVDLMGPTDMNAHSTELATNASTEHAEENGNLGMEEVKQTVVKLEEHTGFQTREEVGAANMNELLQSDGERSVLDNKFSASLCETCVVDSTSIGSLSSQKHGTSVYTHELSVEVLVDLACQEGESSCSAQTMGAVYLNDNANASLDVSTASLPFMSLPISDSSADFIAEPSKEQPEQPSPVSVLDQSFQEELLVATELKELSSDLEELQARLSLDKSFNGDNGHHNVDNVESELEASMHAEKICVAEGGYADNIQVNGGDGSSKSFDIVEDMGKESDMLYVKNILVASGLTGDGATALRWWYAPGQPLNPFLFQKMESNSSDQEKPNGFYNQAAPELNRQGKEMFNVLRRRLLFDSANEVLLNVLGPHLNRHLWLRSQKPTLRVPTGQDLVKVVWSCVWCSLCSHSGSQETLENLVTKDLAKGGNWLDVGAEIEAAGLDVERAILDDLIEEVLLVL